MTDRAAGPPPITFRRVRRTDFPLLGRWLAEPHNRRWWNHDPSPSAVERDFGPTADGTEPSEDLLAMVDGAPVGLVQRSRLADYPGYLAEFAALTDVPDGAITIDYLIGEAARTGQGLGTAVIRAAVAQTWQEYSEAPAILVAVVAANRFSWRALELAGLRRVATGDMEPDNPIDSREHVVYRIDRP